MAGSSSYMSTEKSRAYEDLAVKMTELHASVSCLTQNIEKMTKTDAEITSMTKIFNQVYVLLLLAHCISSHSYV
jgi:NADH:ubiquinone oxidoreductase subunit D